MTNEELKQLYKNRDRVIRVLSKDGKIRAAAIKNTQTAKTAQEKHELDYISASILARALSSASLLATFLKGEERVIVEAEGSGPLARVFAEAIQVGEVRGFVRIKEDFTPGEISSIEELLGLGLFKVTRLLYNEPEPVQGIVPLEKGDISTDLAYYLTQSEQIRSAVVLDVLLNEDGSIKQSGGVIIQAMPGAEESDIEPVYESLTQAPPLGELLDKGFNTEEILQELLPFEFDVIKTSQTDFHCRCSKEKFMKQLLTLGPKEIKEMHKAGNSELVCQYCNSKYILDEADFTQLIEESSAKLN